MIAKARGRISRQRISVRAMAALFISIALCGAVLTVAVANGALASGAPGGRASGAYAPEDGERVFFWAALLEKQGYSFEIWRTNPDADAQRIIAWSNSGYGADARAVTKSIEVLDTVWHFRLAPVELPF